MNAGTKRRPAAALLAVVLVLAVTAAGAATIPITGNITTSRTWTSENDYVLTGVIHDEINGLTLGAVGRQTDIDHVEILRNKDDLGEFFGGTVGVYEAEAKIRQARILVSQERYREAVPLLKRAQEIRPRDDVARYLEQVERLARTRG